MATAIAGEGSNRKRLSGKLAGNGAPSGRIRFRVNSADASQRAFAASKRRWFEDQGFRVAKISK